MKKSIITLMIIAVIAISTTVAFAANTPKTWTPGSFVSEPDWTVMNGDFGGSFSGDGVYSIPGSDYSSAAHTLTASADGNFELDIPFVLNGDKTTAYVGLSTASSPSDNSGWTVIGNGPDDALGFSHGGLSNIDYFGDSPPVAGTKYTAKIISTDGGKTATLSVDGYPGSAPVNLNGAPTYVILYLNNNGITGNSANVPDVDGITYKYDVSDTSATPTPTASPNPGTTVNGQDLAGVRDFYAHQPVVHMSNQSVVYNVDGTIKQVITGTAGSVSAPTTAPATNATKPVVAAPANATATAKPANATAVAVPSTAAPTKSQSPGFEIILAAMGMIAALALITRKKK